MRTKPLLVLSILAIAACGREGAPDSTGAWDHRSPLTGPDASASPKAAPSSTPAAVGDDAGPVPSEVADARQPCPHQPTEANLISCLAEAPLFPPQVAGPARIRIAVWPFADYFAWLGVPWDRDAAVADSQYLFIDLTPNGQVAVHAGECPSGLDLAAYASDDGGTLHLLCQKRALDSPLVTAVHGVAHGFDKVRWSAPVSFRTARWQSSHDPAVLALADGGAFVLLSTHSMKRTHGSSEEMFADSWASERGWEIHPLRTGAGTCNVECPIGFFTRGARLVGVLAGSDAWQKYRTVTADLGGSCSTAPLRPAPAAGVPAAFDVGNEMPWNQDLPVLWSQPRPGALELSLPLAARPIDPSNPQEIRGARQDAAGLVTFSSARPAGGPRAYGAGIALFSDWVDRDIFLRGPDGREVTLAGDRPRWVRASCDERQRCVSVDQVDSFDRGERFDVQRFALADILRRPRAERNIHQ